MLQGAANVQEWTFQNGARGVLSLECSTVGVMNSRELRRSCSGSPEVVGIPHSCSRKQRVSIRFGMTKTETSLGAVMQQREHVVLLQLLAAVEEVEFDDECKSGDVAA